MKKDKRKFNPFIEYYIYYIVYYRGGCMGAKNRLKEIRMREYMMDQKSFSKMIGISNTTYNNIELGRVQGNIETALKIAKALNLKVEDIWQLED